MSDFQDWLEKVTHGDSAMKIAEKANLNYTTFYTHKRDDKITTDEIIAIARAYEIPIIEALVHSNVISRDEVGQEKDLRSYSVLELCQAILWRTEHGLDKDDANRSDTFSRASQNIKEK
jgi:hypothetical protein